MFPETPAPPGRTITFVLNSECGKFETPGCVFVTKFIIIYLDEKQFAKLNKQKKLEYDLKVCFHFIVLVISPNYWP